MLNVQPVPINLNFHWQAVMGPKIKHVAPDGKVLMGKYEPS